MHTEAEADTFAYTDTSETVALIAYFLLCNMVISCYGGTESQSNHAAVGLTSTSTSINSGTFIMMNIANIQRVSLFLLISNSFPLGNMIIHRHGIIVIFISIDYLDNGALM